uniref:Beclin 1-associated autophagy-related key regulator n=1 Tax=Glossina brevipalpis TaxID=37001 RepID=A0A1A9W7C8_9MUSC
MASSSDESSKAPDNFHVSSTSNDDDDDEHVLKGSKLKSKRQSREETVSSTATLKCLICNIQQQKFHCRDCVKNGYITRKGHPHSECLSNKQQKYINLHAGLQVLSQQYERLIKNKKSNENVQFEVKCRREKVSLLHGLLTKKKGQLQKLMEQRNALAKANSDKSKTLPKYPIKVKELEDYVLDRIEKISKLRERHQSLLEKKQEVTRRNIQQLVEYIFPISEVVLKDEQRRPVPSAGGDNSNKSVNLLNEESETIAALADAKNTSYIRGKWVFHGSGISEMQYRIIAPSLPANGDYTAYIDWLKDNKDDVPKSTANEITPSRVNAFRIVGALTYTTQLTQLISYYLNVRLPYRLAYGDFCKKLNEEQFLRKVSRLNSNIMYLAYTQQVKLRTLNENHTLENLLVLLDTDKSDLGRYGFQEVANAPLMKSVDSLLIGIETATESESEDENSLRLDWESVEAQHEIINSNLLPATGQQQSTIAEGLMTSAANRINSILRWIK